MLQWQGGWCGLPSFTALHIKGAASEHFQQGAGRQNKKEQRCVSKQVGDHLFTHRALSPRIRANLSGWTRASDNRHLSLETTGGKFCWLHLLPSAPTLTPSPNFHFPSGGLILHHSSMLKTFWLGCSALGPAFLHDLCPLFSAHLDNPQQTLWSPKPQKPSTPGQRWHPLF